MAERYPEAELVLDDELLYDEAPRRSVLRHADDRLENVVREGEVLAGKYRVERIPGRNGLGVLVQVRHMELGQEVTLKFLVPEACAYPEFVHRFVREARSAVRIQGEHVARITDVGRLESGAPYMVREYLRGPDLAEVLKVRGPLPVEEAVDYVVQACEGVAEGHALGVVHRNIRPTSLVVARRSDGSPLVKVFDFAAAESLHVNPFTERAVSLVGTSAIMASLPYLAPEQIRDPHDVDFRADVYSLGAVLFELLTGTAVYTADAAPALLAQVAADAAPAVRTLRADVPGELDHIVLRCLAKNRAIRYGSLAELVMALAPFASVESSSSIERIIRLGKRTSKLPSHSEPRSPSPLPPAAAPLPSTPAPQPSESSAGNDARGRARHDTLPLHTTDSPNQTTLQSRKSVYEDVTAINPYTAYTAPVVIHAEPARREPTRTEPLPLPLPVPPPAARPVPSAEPPASAAPRRTLQPPPMRASAPPPLHQAPVAPPAATPMPAHPQPSSHLSGTDTTALPPPRSSVPGLARSWAVPDEPVTPLFTKNRLVAVGAIAAAATLAGVFALRSGPSAPVAAAAAPPVQAKPPSPPPPQPVPPPEPAAAPSASVAPSVAAVAPAAPAPAPAVPPAAAIVQPVSAPVARPLAPAPWVAPPKPMPVAKKAPAREEPGLESARKPAPAEKVASSRPAGRDLFDDPN